MRTADIAASLFVAEESLKGTSRLLNEIKEILKVPAVPEKPEVPKFRHPYQSGVQTITNATLEGSYPVVIDFLSALDKPSTSGSLTNYGAGNLFIKFSKNRVSLSASELKLRSLTRLEWDAEVFYYIHVRTDVDGTTWQSEAT